MLWRCESLDGTEAHAGLAGSCGAFALWARRRPREASGSDLCRRCDDTGPDGADGAFTTSVSGAATQTEDIGRQPKVSCPRMLDRLFTLGVRWNEISLSVPSQHRLLVQASIPEALASAGRWEQLAQEIERERAAMEQEK